MPEPGLWERAAALHARGVANADEGDLLEAARLLAQLDPNPADPLERLRVTIVVVTLAIDLYHVAGHELQWDGVAADLRAAIDAAPPGAPERADALSMLGVLRQLQFRHDGARATLAAAIDAFRTAADDVHGAAATLAGRLDNLARAHMQWQRAGLGSEYLEDAEHAARRAVALASDQAAYLVTLGEVLHARGALEGDPARREARERFHAAARIHPPSTVAVDAALSSAWTSLEAADWPAALEEFGLAADLADRRLGGLDSLPAKLRGLEEWERWAGTAAVAAARAGRPERGVELLERGRGFLLRQELSIPTQELAFDQLVRRATDTPAVYLACSPFGGVALVVHRGAARAVEIPALTVNESPFGLRARLLEYLDAYDDARHHPWARRRWAGVLEGLAAWAGPAVVQPVIEALDGARSVRLLPVGPLALVPWQAASWPDPHSANRRIHALDEVTISFAPTLTALAWTAPPRRDGAAVAVCDPRPTSLPALPATALEATGMAVALPAVKPLNGEAATREAVLAAFRRADIVHLACHAVSEPWAPASSYLVVSGDEQITVADLRAERLGAELVVLSACETNAAGRLLSDEALTLSYALLETSVKATIGSSWVAPDMATAAIMTRFYDEWVDRGLAASEALPAAQRWFRDSDATEVAAYLTERLPDVVDASMLGDIDPPGFHHSQPLFWAAFVYAGA